VRPIYQAFCVELPRLTEPYGIELSQATQCELAILIRAMDSIDRELDSTLETDKRQMLSSSIIAFLRGDESSAIAERLGRNLTEQLAHLRNTVRQRGIGDEFAKAAQAVLVATEAKRWALTTSDFLRCLELEWRLVGELPLQILGAQTPQSFRQYFLNLCGAMYPIDTIPDMWDDYRRGQIAIRPSWWLAAVMACRLGCRLPKLVLTFPRPWRIIGYARALWKAHR
jgi:hypothetical protein